MASQPPGTASHSRIRRMDSPAVRVAGALVASAVLAALLWARRNRRAQDNDTRPVIKIGTRASALAVIQTQYVASLLRKGYPEINFVVTQGVHAKGDQVLNVPLKDIVVKSPGLFTKELEDGLLSREYDLVVHSLKDVPTSLPNGLVIAGITEREDPRDALVVNAKHRGKGGLRGLPAGAVIGTSSVRREAILRRDFPSFQIKLIRGNVNTRLRKLDDGEFDAIILAIAGLKRLGAAFEARAEELLDPENFPYGVSQGALGLECRSEDSNVCDMLAAIGHEATTSRCLAERALLRHLQGGCQVPLGVHSIVSTRVDAKDGQSHQWLEIRCSVLSTDGRVTISAQAAGPATAAEDVGISLAKHVLASGGSQLVQGWVNPDVALARPMTYGSAE